MTHRPSTQDPLQLPEFTLQDIFESSDPLRTGFGQSHIPVRANLPRTPPPLPPPRNLASNEIPKPKRVTYWEEIELGEYNQMDGLGSGVRGQGHRRNESEAWWPQGITNCTVSSF